MFRKEKRIRLKDEIGLIFRKGQRRRSSLIAIWVYNKDRGPFRALIICSRKVDKRATRRNLLRRRVRDILRRDVELNFPKSDIIVEIQAVARNSSYSELKKDILNVLHI